MLCVTTPFHAFVSPQKAIFDCLYLASNGDRSVDVCQRVSSWPQSRVSFVVLGFGISRSAFNLTAASRIILGRCAKGMHHGPEIGPFFSNSFIIGF